MLYALSIPVEYVPPQQDHIVGTRLAHLFIGNRRRPRTRISNCVQESTHIHYVMYAHLASDYYTWYLVLIAYLF